ncbi:MAG: hypothetical protein CMN89_08050 [Sutterellaceae bacterium]|uniref:hypothetical protein n=1 Tax=unclassified Limnobacter TaxID=2630203 RepID=UPI000C430CAC|nr:MULTISPECIES: hypothetical protein [unclassified Limnobacter]MAG81916.1 hypothetical protein [Sutterellaceae bacterium]MBT84420.1 hypothetical protein [Sutterellaceae bacterium]|tara:strand:+ start:10773 stop:11312 length:540 start_codon:yes stop_codon:yes gene_type:complete
MSQEPVSDEFVKSLLAKNKQSTKGFEWKALPNTVGHRFTFETALDCDEVTLEGVLFRSIYQKLPPRTKGIATIQFEEIQKVMIQVHSHRIWAIDDDSKGHKNPPTKPGATPRLFDGKQLTSRAHMHIWQNGEESYAEPVAAPPNNLEGLFQLTTACVKIKFQEPFVHPLKGVQEQLFNE